MISPEMEAALLGGQGLAEHGVAGGDERVVEVREASEHWQPVRAHGAQSDAG